MLRCTTQLIPGRAAQQRLISSLHAAIPKGAPIDVHPEVEEALAKNKPVVALETTIVTHGMPEPTNLECARSVEQIVRDQGAVPATIGIIQGRVKIGLEPSELEYLADTSRNPSVVKVSRRDIGPSIALKRDGGTTCSTTLIFAAMAGIKVFATGGLGGVHRGGELSMDVSADLHELSRCPVGLVSAGVKSILDIGRTLEYLETLGVPVVSYGPTDEFPAFYSRRSGFKSPWRVDDPASAAQILHTQHQLGMSNGAIFGVPIPEAFEAVGEELQAAVEQAVREAESKGVDKWGKAATPWLLGRVGELTRGKSLASNVALIQNTARVGGQIAVEYANMSKLQDGGGRSASHSTANTYPLPTTYTSSHLSETALPKPEVRDVTVSAKVMVVGSAAIDIISQADTSEDPLQSKSTLPGKVSTSLGGVGRNVAEAAHRILTATSSSLTRASVLVSPIGKDSFGRMLAEETNRIGMRNDGLTEVENGRTAVCNMILDRTGNLIGGVADMDIIQEFKPEMIVEAMKRYSPQMIAVDGNLSEVGLTSVLRQSIQDNVQVFFEPTSVTKSTRILPAIASSLHRLQSDLRAPVSFASPNLLELKQLYTHARSEPLELTSHDHWWKVIDNFALGTQYRQELELLARRDADDHSGNKGTLAYLVDQGVAQMAVHLLPFFQHLVIKCGEFGIFAVFRIPQKAAKTSPWVNERSNIKERHIVAHGKDGEILVLKHFPALVLPPEDILNVTGAGDTLVGSVLADLAQAPTAFEDPSTLDLLMSRAQKAAIMTLKSDFAVSPTLSLLN